MVYIRTAWNDKSITCSCVPDGFYFVLWSWSDWKTYENWSVLSIFSQWGPLSQDCAQCGSLSQDCAQCGPLSQDCAQCGPLSQDCAQVYAQVILCFIKCESVYHSCLFNVYQSCVFNVYRSSVFNVYQSCVFNVYRSSVFNVYRSCVVNVVFFFALWPSLAGKVLKLMRTAQF